MVAASCSLDPCLHDPEETCGERLFDHHVGEREQLRRHVEAQRLRGFEIDDQFELGRLYNWKIGGLLALKNPADMHASLTIIFRTVHSVADEASNPDKLALRVDRRQPIAGGQRDILTAVGWSASGTECRFAAMQQFGSGRRRSGLVAPPPARTDATDPSETLQCYERPFFSKERRVW